jgi:hypothetical protein
MKKSLATLATLFVGCATGVFVQSLAAQSIAPGRTTSATKWEMLCVIPKTTLRVPAHRVDTDLTAGFNELGMKGWEPVGIAYSHETMGHRFCFKRPTP